MGIYTKTGDQGTTSLVGGGRVRKDNPRVEAYGEVDELISFLGIIISSEDHPSITPNVSKHIRESILRIQQNLMLVAAHFATPQDANKQVKPLDEAETKFLENEIDAMAAQTPAQKSFILPGNPKVAAECHYARTICRRCERRSLSVIPEGEEIPVNTGIGIRYLNRLSDYLFTLARYLCTITSTPEQFWQP